MTISTQNYSPMKTPSPNSLQSQVHERVVLFCEKVAYGFQSGKIDAEACCYKLLEAAEKTNWDVPEKLIRNLNVYLSKVLERSGGDKFKLVINKIYVMIECNTICRATLEKGIFQEMFVDHIFQSDLFKQIPIETVGEIEDIIALSTNFHSYGIFKERDLNEILDSFLRKYIRVDYQFKRDEFDYEQQVAASASRYHSSLVSRNLYSERIVTSERFGLRIYNILNAILKSHPEQLKEKIDYILNYVDVDEDVKFCDAVIEIIKSSNPSNSVTSLSFLLLSCLSSGDCTYSLAQLKNKIKGIISGNDGSIKTNQELTNFLTWYRTLGRTHTFIGGFFSPSLARKIAQSMDFSGEEKSRVFDLLVDSDRQPPSADEIEEKNPWKEAFFKFTELPGVTRSTQAIIRWSLIFFDDPTELCRRIEGLSYSDWSRFLRVYMDETEVSQFCHLGKGFDFIQQSNESLYASKVLKKDFNYTVLNELLNHVTTIFEFNSIDGGGSVSQSKNLRRSLEHIAIDYPLQYKQVLSERVQGAIEFLKNTSDADDHTRYFYTCFLLQLALGFMNDFVDKDTADVFIQKISEIEDVSIRRKVIKNLLSLLSEETVQAIGLKQEDSEFYHKVRHELICRIHPNFLNHIWRYVKSKDQELYQEICQCVEGNEDWWTIIFDEGQLKVLVMELVEALSEKLSDSTAQVIYPYLSLLVEAHKQPQKQMEVALAFSSAITKKCDTSPDQIKAVEEIIQNLMSCLKKEHWQYYHEKFKIYQNLNYIEAELYDRPIYKTFLENVICSLRSHPEKFGRSMEIIQKQVIEEHEWLDLFFSTSTVREKLDKVLKCCHQPHGNINHKEVTRELIGFVGGFKKAENIYEAVDYAFNHFENLSFNQKKMIVLNVFSLFAERNLKSFYCYNQEGYSLFVDEIKKQNSHIGSNFINELYKRLITEPWFHELFRTYLHRELSADSFSSWLDILIPSM